MELQTGRERDSKRLNPGELGEPALTLRSHTSIITPHLWAHRDQEITSVVTSVNSKKLPALFRKVAWQTGTVNADLGAGKYHGNVTEYLRSLGVENWAFDPFSITLEANLEAIRNIAGGQCDTVTITNCANVIQDPIDRDLLFLRAHNALKPGGTLFCQFHEGNKSGIGRVSQSTRDGKPLAWQENRRTRDYVKDIAHLFADIRVRDNVITARKS